MEALVLGSGLTLVLIVAAIFYYLAHESRYAFDRKFDYGFRFALQPTQGEYEKDLSLDPNASLLTANREGSDGLDEHEEAVALQTLEQLSGVGLFGTGSSLGSAKSTHVYRDDWRSMKRASEGQRYHLIGFATPEYKRPTMVLAWEPDASFNPANSPFDLRLRLVRGPSKPFDINLKRQPRGRLEIPTYVAHSDAARTQGYVFELSALPAASQQTAVVGGLFDSKWDPTLAYPRFGIVPLLVGTACVTLLAVLLATPVAIATAVYLSELAPKRLREWIKPALELLASVPTVVLGYLGLMLLAPALQATFAQAVGLESGRALLTTSLVMAVLLVPTIATVAEDGVRAVPSAIRAGGDALGLTNGESIRKLIVPAARAGLIAALLLGIARAVGETMIVWILSGGTPTMPSFGGVKDSVANLMRPVRGIPDTVAIEMGNVDFEGVHYGHLFLLGMVLFAATLALNLGALRLARRAAWRH